ncbi:rhomboid family intramembrane serine protease [Lutibacter maritimus]|uniref:Membrane associated serine protease, rhomboid family n=1 Tax=Lutibacter maritimus TaxID=593133 RepID=A0A1I6R6S7_9FLAO|nr:rhomboid family intramembrane serine protease [Lutibacter maritimus]SFS60379.1 Membrane associated serine protease, rhomboid family [Lutibacter maritimus]
MSDNQFKTKKGTFIIPILALLAIWVVYIIEIGFGFNFNKFGIYPNNIIGLRGILFSPFIHADIKHLLNNSVPLFVMLCSLYYFYHKIATKVLVLGTLVLGFLTWFIARPANHIGASGVIYFLVSFIFFSGIFRKYYRLIALSLAVVFLYGSMIWYVLPIEESISWEGHLSGFITGLVFTILFKKVGPQPEIFEFTPNEEFENLFDENGNYIPPEEFQQPED